jgi:hypothetical protein
MDMTPNRSNNYCCGGGGSATGFPEARRAYGKLKFDQIMATGATYANTLPQLPRPDPRPSEHYGGSLQHGAPVDPHLSGRGTRPNERTYLGEDLADLLMPEVREVEEE